MRQPELGRVFRGYTLRITAEMGVQIDEARQDVITLEIEHPVTRLCLGPAVFLDWHAGVADISHITNSVALDNDVHRPYRRRALAVDHRYAAQDQSLVRTVTPLTVGGRFGRRMGRKTRENDQKQYQGGNYFLHYFSRTS